MLFFIESRFFSRLVGDFIYGLFESTKGRGVKYNYTEIM